VLINIYNILGQKTPLLLKPVKIEMDVSNANLDDVWAITMRFYFWNESTQMWEESTSVFDVATKRLTGETYHFSHIAAFGEKKTGWTDTITVTNTTFALK
jgi:aspartate carbamoyltransferase catalytic subunit